MPGKFSQKIDQQSERLFKNTSQFVNGYPSNDVLMTGARGIDTFMVNNFL
jgi:predicted AAA+ superfamily ATPase